MVYSDMFNYKYSFNNLIPFKHQYHLTAIIAVLFIIVFNQPAFCADAPYPLDIKKIKDRGKLIVTQFSGERPGFFMFDNENKYPTYPSYDYQGQRLIGFDIEIAKKIADRLGVDLELRRTEKSFTNLCKIVGRDEADLAISKITITMDRGQYVNFTKPYVILRIGLLLNRVLEVKANRKNDIFHLLNNPLAKIAVQKGTSWVPFGRDLFPKAQLIEYPSMDKALNAVESGKTLAFLNDEWNIASKLKQRPELTLRVRLEFVPDIKSGISIAVSPNSPNLFQFLNLMIERDQMSTTPNALLETYFSAGSAQEVANAMARAEKIIKPAQTPMSAIVIIAAIVFALIVFWFFIALRRSSVIGDQD